MPVNAQSPDWKLVPNPAKSIARSKFVIEFVTWYFVLFWPAYVFAAAGLAAIWTFEWAGFKICYPDIDNKWWQF